MDLWSLLCALTLIAISMTAALSGLAIAANPDHDPGPRIVGLMIMMAGAAFSCVLGAGLGYALQAGGV